MPIDFDALEANLRPCNERLEQMERDISNGAVLPEPSAPPEPRRSNSEYIPSQEEIDANPSAALPDLPEIVDAFEFAAVEIPEPPQLIRGAVHLGTKVVVGGGSKSFKTWVLLDAAISVAYGVPWLGCETVPGRVLFVNFEIQEAFFQRRIQRICEAKGIQQQPGRLEVWNLRGKNAAYDIIIPQIIERVKTRDYAMDIFDPVYKLYGNTNENDATEVSKLLNSLEKVCVDTKAAVMFGAHYSKGNQSGKESIDRISGSGVFARDPDSIISFTRHEQDDCFTIEPILRNFAPMQPFVVRWKYPLFIRDLDLDPDDLRKAPGRKKNVTDFEVLSAIGQTTEESPITISYWSDLLGMSRTTLIGYLPTLRSRHLIQTLGEGTKARQFITQKGREHLASFTVGI